jgi:hypothetical protein
MARHYDLRMALTDLIIKAQEQLLRDVHALWSTVPVPDWKRPESELTGAEREHVELAYYLAERSYEAANGYCCSESVFIWCRADVAAYYLGGYLLHAIENLSDPNMRPVDFWLGNLNSFLEIDSLYREVYLHILQTTPAMIPIVGRYGDLLHLCREAGPSPGWRETWRETEPWPDEPGLIERIRSLWRDRNAFQKAIEAFRAIDGN